MRLLAASLMLVSFAAFAGEPAVPAASSDQAAQPEVAAAPTPVAAASTSASEHKRVCTRETSVGSHIARTVCRDDDSVNGGQALERLRNDINRVTPSPQQTSH